MTLDKLRRSITVQEYTFHSQGIEIKYKLHGEVHVLKLNITSSLSHLDLNSLIDSYSGETAIIDEKEYSWGLLISTHTLSQWDAINIVARYEYGVDVEKDSTLLEIDSALAALKNN